MNVVLAYARPEDEGAKRKWTLADQAEDINKDFEKLAQAGKRIEDRHNAMLASERAATQIRWRLGKKLVHAREMLREQDSGASFEAWCEANLKRSMRDIYRLIQIARREEPACQPLPQEEYAGTETVQYQQKELVKKENRRITTALGLYRKMSVDEREEVKRGQEEIDNA